MTSVFSCFGWLLVFEWMKGVKMGIKVEVMAMVVVARFQQAVEVGKECRRAAIYDGNGSVRKASDPCQNWFGKWLLLWPNL